MLQPQIGSRKERRDQFWEMVRWRWHMDAFLLRASCYLLGPFRLPGQLPGVEKENKNVDYLSKFFKWKWVRIFKHECDFHSKKCFLEAKNICWCFGWIKFLRVFLSSIRAVHSSVWTCAWILLTYIRSWDAQISPWMWQQQQEMRRNTKNKIHDLKKLLKNSK